MKCFEVRPSKGIKRFLKYFIEKGKLYAYSSAENLKKSFPLKWRIFLMQKYPFIPAQNFSFICSKIYTKIF
jgi:5'(3')-deoxyribonucleotidase